ncbi:D-glycero-alpha-D-manno-heptose-1,7-bisphosphate 7-phosphatase [Aureibacter tunicatorum]|uniref:D,D-heptose 1,7-bisphosphate phosphatase n=1 Tax=Aureibacter tunicatorum TaxID=866807 RepID=A0AAE3XLY4_9BACT|nr:HAD family hydrolase [Aureibacter tunicatorum]MDR6238216.1 D-glycero-D-manno-heptose 1,7-bisphosphate phosphatase [Aureibacter tunicatorum]BDD03249.1 D-glycero-alpha-D-manno-heptose-1,7-bisphosphate 7-phosphatase [Aureibacter tunicatorum]
MNKCVFLDRDGVLNVERGEYTYKTSDFVVEIGVAESLNKLKAAGFLLIVITNQAGIAKGLYEKEDVLKCHQKLQSETGNQIDALYYSPYHPLQTESLTRKPDSLMFEKAIAKFNIDPAQSWMIGDKERDIVPANKLGIQGILISDLNDESLATAICSTLPEAAEIILNSDQS